jgi:hypothetical protein
MSRRACGDIEPGPAYFLQSEDVDTNSSLASWELAPARATATALVTATKV